MPGISGKTNWESDFILAILYPVTRAYEYFLDISSSVDSMVMYMPGLQTLPQQRRPYEYGESLEK